MLDDQWPSLAPCDVEFARELIWYRSGQRFVERWVSIGMPKLGKFSALLKSVVFLYPTEVAAKTGEAAGGTGFLVGIPSQKWGDRLLHVHVVTNKHVAVHPAEGPPNPVIRINSKSGAPKTYDLGPDQWTFPKSGPDIAVSPPIDLPASLDVRCLDIESFFLTPEKEVKEEIGPAEDVFMVGRFVDYDGAEVNTPAVRFGHISIMDAKIRQRTGFQGRSIVIDMHSRSGFSGSPVFAYRTIGSHFMEASKGPPGQKVLTSDGLETYVRLLGLHWGQFPELWELKKRQSTPARENSLIKDGEYVEGLSGMTCVIPSAYVKETLLLPEMVEMRKKREEAINQSLSEHQRLVPKTESVSTENDSNPSHKEDFNRLLDAAVKPPKSSDQT